MFGAKTSLKEFKMHSQMPPSVRSQGRIRQDLNGNDIGSEKYQAFDFGRKDHANILSIACAVLN
jgi:hypothetical protein